MSNEFVLKVIEALKSIKVKRTNDCLGICFNLNVIISGWTPYVCSIGIVEKYCVGWKDITEPRCDPIFDYENHNIEKWEGTNLELRIDLINHIINRLKNENVTDEEIWSLQ